MTIEKVREIVDAEVLTHADQLQFEIESAFGADLMSDVLAFSNAQSMLLTGLINPQVIRTAEMMDMRVVLFVRGKKPTPEIVELAESRDIILLATAHTMYRASGMLYEQGLR